MDELESSCCAYIVSLSLSSLTTHPYSSIALRGWAHHGPSAFPSGRHDDFFLLLDRLPESLEDRMSTWRHSLAKYQAKRKMPWAKQKFADKIQTQFARRLEVALDLASAIAYMHERRLIHRDIKPGNAGFTVDGDLKIFDFGLARLLPPESQRTKGGGFWMSRVGTKDYMAPEVRRKFPYDEKADVYSWGVVLWEILAVSTPRETLLLRKKGLHEENTAAQLPLCPCWPPEVSSLLQSLWSPMPSNRPSMTDVCRSLGQQLCQMGLVREKPRRRSSFRLDLTEACCQQTLATAASTVSDSLVSGSFRSTLSDDRMD